ncbi:MAG: class I SAM-dependent RNA methyltransferase [Zymomonas mobilis subsp. pomaceae]|uniref:(Uracil-5)-methyltransferase n=1 Tax=Zymomonas mobilis subsp. pomaceae (strain ATCC 29192 / DSM 22645 / JCM 10191 / CCUG 17912 / NBRC 13757 / NCIMB 11200 / NRRL B-4491 / Barker I) TaxID=579138 RepID=F8ETL7_ZYMMT|nr:class I SAM-dependent RNA methyltransferase [Zymomonas mobilis]AEI37027.1 (Uracil-5)-methyltransferase [Zymomonas mobilis subsp. pomaceae ATCC 29192]MDX5948399.1 class I SAM-dependent RNA methyltransferase [Zymomonas mobilis subsp. pomaceae]GEB89611.1 putative RNA methyltransferase R00878 [Zymomonas mobilis subsp. pomaceae]
MNEVIRLASKGDGVTADGQFIPYSVPGDYVDEEGVLIKGPHHVAPVCSHFPVCGGCRLQYVDDTVYKVFLKDRIAEAFHQQGLSTPLLRETYLSPAYSRRRVSLRAFKAGKKLTLGYNKMASHQLIDIKECPLLEDKLFQAIADLRPFLQKWLKPRSLAQIEMTVADQGIDCLIAMPFPESLEATEAVTIFAQEKAFARLSIDQGYGPETRWEPEPVTVTLSGVRVDLPSHMFLQATKDGEQALVTAVKEAVGSSEIIADLFSGLGTFALAMPEKARVYAAEGLRDATLALKKAAGRAGKSVFVEHRDLFRRPLQEQELSRFDCIILDPPRAGAKEQIPALAKLPKGRLVYVSCNPATFARDAQGLLAAGWQLSWVIPVGQFHWSLHVEMVGYFSKG